jgi:SAM-dependent methyltransferase
VTASVSPELVDQLQSSSSLLDRATAEACRHVIARHATEWSAWEIERGLAELAGLGRHRDCTYDRPSIGVSYALWYQGKRTHDALRMLAPRIAGVEGSLRIVDLGCGTGATACAVALAVVALDRCGLAAVTEIVVDGVDSSPFMVEVAREIFAALVRDMGCSCVRATFRSMPWASVAAADGAPTAIVGGYLLDHSDGAHADEIAQRLKALADKLSASSILLSTAAGKGSQLKRVQTALERDEWQSTDRNCELGPAIAGGQFGECHALRMSWYKRHGLTADRLWRSPPSWSSDRLAARLTMNRRPGRIAVTLFDDARDGRLHDATQATAASPEERLTVIVGAAGSGKTIVLSERIARTVAVAQRSEPTPVVLVTAFNKAVVDLIAAEVVRALEATEGVTLKHTMRGEGDHELRVVVRGRTARVELMNRDRLPVRVFEVAHIKGELKGDWWKREIDRRAAKLAAADRALVARLGHDFLEDELERVIYGLACLDLAQYANVDRIGRVTPLAKGRTREVVWRLLMEPPIESYVNQRVKAYRKHEAAVTHAHPAALERKWTHVFVDECQDFTRSDIRLLARAPRDPRHLCMAGDASQAIHLGRPYNRPGIAGAQWKTHLLEGSYRLPLRVCEALQPLARNIRSSHLASRLEDDLDTVLLRSRKASVAGFRPIVLTGQHVADQLGDVLRAYVFEGERQRLLAADCGRRTREAAGRAARDCSWMVEQGDMRKYKGLEWPCVVVTNERRSWRDTSEAASERLFTAMTRTTALLVIVLWEDGDADTTALLGRLDGDRLLFWDEAASTAFDRARHGAPATW